MLGDINVLFIAAEAEPFVKVGGLGDVAGSLPRYLRKLPPGIAGGRAPDVRLVLPLHSILKPDKGRYRPFSVFSIPYRSGAIPVQVFLSHFEGMPVYLLDAEPIGRTGSVYATDSVIDAEKYTVFSLAALELTRRLDWRPNILHANDWHTALACYALLLRRRLGEFEDIVTVLTIHNLHYMGPDLGSTLQHSGLAAVQTGLPAWARARPLALGIWAADGLVAVSPSYAAEIQTEALGCGLHGYLSARNNSLLGILNGIDTESYNPALDPAIPSNFGIPTLDRRSLNKTALQMRLGLRTSEAIPLVAVVSRLDPQKGIDLLAPALRRLRGAEWQAVILGTGAPTLERSLKRLGREFADRIRIELRYDAVLARQIYAGADILLMPSRYEPCGLAQLFAMRYGCVPIVSAVGGLRDTVVDAETGLVLGAPSSAHLASAITRAVSLLADRREWTRMQKAGMSKDFSWASSARQYLELYQRLLARVDTSRQP